jgi:hypothetical protein
MRGFAENSERMGLRQLHAWKSGESASSEKASARVRRSDSSSSGERA